MAKTKTRTQELLKTAVLRLQLPNALTATPVGAASLFYLQRTTDLPSGMMWPIVVSSAVSVLVLVPIMQLVYIRMTGAISKLAAGKLEPTVANLQLAVRQAHRFPERLIAMVAAVWISITIVLVGSLKLTAVGLTPHLAYVIMARAALILPMGLAVAYLSTTYSARGVIERIKACGLTVDQLIEAIPTTRRQTRLRVVIFMLVLVATPVIICIDLATAVVTRGVAQVRAAGPELQSAVADQVLSDARMTVLVMGIVILALGLLGASLWGASMAQPLRALASQADRIARGDLSVPTVTVAEDETWVVSVALARLHQDLSKLLTDMQRAGFSVSTAAEQMLSHAESSRSGAANQALSAHQTSSATEEMARVAEQIAEKAGSVAETAAHTLNAARSGQESSQVFNDAISSLARDNLAVADAVVRLKKGMNQIGRIVDFINGIADKSDLLALNAELEGTKAGDLGRGFSLVAGEMRRLAENILKSTREIAQLIEEVREATQAAVLATETGIHATETGARVADQLAQALQQIVELAQATAESATTINFATQQQRSSSAQLAETMQSILEVSQTTEAATKHVSSSSTDLAQLARQLKGTVDRFKLDA